MQHEGREREQAPPQLLGVHDLAVVQLQLPALVLRRVGQLQHQGQLAGQVGGLAHVEVPVVVLLALPGRIDRVLEMLVEAGELETEKIVVHLGRGPAQALRQPALVGVDPADVGIRMSVTISPPVFRISPMPAALSSRFSPVVMMASSCSSLNSPSHQANSCRGLWTDCAGSSGYTAQMHTGVQDWVGLQDDGPGQGLVAGVQTSGPGQVVIVELQTGGPGTQVCLGSQRSGPGQLTAGPGLQEGGLGSQRTSQS